MKPGAGPGLPEGAVVVTPSVLRAWALPRPGADADKTARGQVLVVGGSTDTVGAVGLAGVAALRSGAGKLQVATAGPVAPLLAVTLPEALVTGLAVNDDGAIVGTSAAAEKVASMVAKARAVLVGPGLSDPDETRPLVDAVLAALPDSAVVVLDAMAATCGAVLEDGRVPEAFRRVADRAVLTPNPAEAAWLLERSAEEIAAAPVSDLSRELADRTGAVVALRGCTSAPDGRVWFDQTGHAGLGTSGSGDVASGIVTGLAARGADPAQAAVWGVALHAEAGQRLAARMGSLGFLARELLDEVPAVLRQLEL